MESPPPTERETLPNDTHTTPPLSLLPTTHTINVDVEQTHVGEVHVLEEMFEHLFHLGGVPRVDRRDYPPCGCGCGCDGDQSINQSMIVLFLRVRVCFLGMRGLVGLVGLVGHSFHIVPCHVSMDTHARTHLGLRKEEGKHTYIKVHETIPHAMSKGFERYRSACPTHARTWV